ncbi:MAG: O-acetyl-ADP-ribose deacetylase [Candidatus Bathyarchaeota archaeon]|nr:MAG: O-acetyl-ADP-ribose deacetylase [Candidatus Bathyarchaeota archaeon]
MEFKIGQTKISVIKGDITQQTTDAIVNAANNSLMGGGGVDGAIHNAGGLKVLEECKRIRRTQWPDGLPTGEAVITASGNLKARYVIHTVGPVWRGGTSREHELLANAYQNSLKLAVRKKLKTIAFPSISTGAYGFPIKSGSQIALKTVQQFLRTMDDLNEIIFVLFSESDLQTYMDSARRIFHI